MDAHNAAKQTDDLHVGQAQFAHRRRDGLLGGVGLEGFENIGVGAGAAAEDPPQAGHEQFQVAEVEAAPERVVRLAEIQRQQPPAGFATRRISRKPASQLARFRKPYPTVTMSKELSANGMRCASPRTKRGGR